MNNCETLDIEMLKDILKKLIYCFINSYVTSYKKYKEFKNRTIDLQISIRQYDSYCRLAISYCGAMNLNVTALLTKSFGLVIEHLKLGEIPLATVFSAGKKCKVGVYIRHLNKVVLIRDAERKVPDDGDWNEYLCIQLKHKLRLCDRQGIEDFVKEEFDQLKKKFLTLNFTLVRDDVIIHKIEDIHISSSRLIASALTKIVERSGNKKFQEECLALFEISNVNRLEYTIFKKLMASSNT